MNTLISGGCKNGKSWYAQRIVKESEGPWYYVATMEPKDEEDLARVARHIRDRDGWGFQTLEQPTDICALLSEPLVDKKGAFLLDSVTALLSNEMFSEDGTMDREAPRRVAAELCRFAQATGNTVFVSDFIYSDAARLGEWTEAYRQGLALIDRALAQVCDSVLEVSYGTVLHYKGEAK